MPRLDRYLTRKVGSSRHEIRQLIARGSVRVDAVVVTRADHIVTPRSHIDCNGTVLAHDPARYLMINKPAGVVSATTDARHTTVLDLLPRDDQAGLHIAGRLDFNSTGLMLLTNDGHWSRNLSLPQHHISKRYHVTVEQPLTPDYVSAFEAGMYFAFEGITTQPAKLRILGEREAEICLIEGRYHQVKRMFGRFNNKVLTLHRSAIGELQLNEALAPGESRPLTQAEVAMLQP